MIVGDIKPSHVDLGTRWYLGTKFHFEKQLNKGVVTNANTDSSTNFTTPGHFLFIAT